MHAPNLKNKGKKMMGQSGGKLFTNIRVIYYTTKNMKKKAGDTRVVKEIEKREEEFLEIISKFDKNMVANVNSNSIKNKSAYLLKMIFKEHEYLLSCKCIYFISTFTTVSLLIFFFIFSEKLKF